METYTFWMVTRWRRGIRPVVYRETVQLPVGADVATAHAAWIDRNAWRASWDVATASQGGV